MALRRRFSSGLPFGCRAILVTYVSDFRPSGSVPPAFAGFAFFDNQAVMVLFHVRPLILRHQFSLVLLFIEVQSYCCTNKMPIQAVGTGFKVGLS
jgi:hypothetical protein